MSQFPEVDEMHDGEACVLRRRLEGARRRCGFPDGALVIVSRVLDGGDGLDGDGRVEETRDIPLLDLLKNNVGRRPSGQLRKRRGG